MYCRYVYSSEQAVAITIAIITLSITLQWLHAAADVEAVLRQRCNSTRPLLTKVTSHLQQHEMQNVELPPRVLLTFMNWTSIDVSIQNLHALADQHGLLEVSRDHIVVLPRVAHADYMTRCGELHALLFCCELYIEMYWVVLLPIAVTL